MVPIDFQRFDATKGAIGFGWSLAVLRAIADFATSRCPEYRRRLKMIASDTFVRLGRLVQLLVSLPDSLVVLPGSSRFFCCNARSTPVRQKTHQQSKASTFIFSCNFQCLTSGNCSTTPPRFHLLNPMDKTFT